MKKTYVIAMIGILLVGLVSAGIGLRAISQSREIDKELRDHLLTKTNETEISPTVDIDKSGDSCKWSAKQVGIIESYDNPFNCSGMSDPEIEEHVADVVQNILEQYANSSLNRQQYADLSDGNVEIRQRR